VRATRRSPSPLRLLADIGGTHARFALQRPGCPPGRVAVFATREHAGPSAAIRTYLDRTAPAEPPRAAALALAAPVLGDRIRLTNRAWSFSVAELRERLGLERIAVVNDFAAVALAAPRLGLSDRRKLGRGRATRGSPLAVLGPGTGLGVSALVPAAPGARVLATEGGHATMAAADEREADILRVLRRRYDHVSAERVLSGPGLVNLYEAIAKLRDVRPARLSPAAISQRALSRRCPVCREAVETFSAMLGSMAGDLALTYGAHGGVFIAGGVVLKLGRAFSAARFRRRFEEKGRFREYLAAIPTYVVTHPRPAFLGLAALLDLPEWAGADSTTVNSAVSIR
jgi:glucokinase